MKSLHLTCRIFGHKYVQVSDGSFEFIRPIKGGLNAVLLQEGESPVEFKMPYQKRLGLRTAFRCQRCQSYKEHFDYNWFDDEIK